MTKTKMTRREAYDALMCIVTKYIGVACFIACVALWIFKFFEYPEVPIYALDDYSENLFRAIAICMAIGGMMIPMNAWYHVPSTPRKGRQ